MTQLPPLNVHFLEHAVRKLATDAPNCVYEKPHDAIFGAYDHGECTNGSVGCIMGQALTRCGLESQLPVAQQWGSILNYILFITETDYDKLPAPVRGTVRWLNEVQQQQDQGRTWGEAVATADRFNQ